jgi:glycosyltransferase involved in cell wall biosynthesis
MKRRPLVSIITIVYNGEKTIADTIRSVERQTYPDIQYIIVDGGSTDDTLRIVREFGGVVTDIISEKDRGISDAFNKGIRRAKGDIVGMINADDWYAPDAVEKAVAAIDGYDVVHGNLQLWKKEGADFILKGDHRFLNHEMTVNHPTVFVRRECYEKFGSFDEQYKCAMDYDLLLRLATRGCKFVYLPVVLANMRWGGMSDVNWRLGCRETRRIKDNYLPNRTLGHRLYYARHVLAIAIPRMLVGARLNFIVRFYRTKFSRIQKVYN